MTRNTAGKAPRWEVAVEEFVAQLVTAAKVVPSSGPSRGFEMSFWVQCLSLPFEDLHGYCGLVPPASLSRRSGLEPSAGKFGPRDGPPDNWAGEGATSLASSQFRIANSLRRVHAGSIVGAQPGASVPAGSFPVGTKLLRHTSPGARRCLVSRVLRRIRHPVWLPIAPCKSLTVCSSGIHVQ